MVEVPPMAYHSPAAVRKAREESLQVKGSRLFNLCPKDLRDMKAGLDAWLATIPDSLQYQGGRRLPSPSPSLTRRSLITKDRRDLNFLISTINV